MFNQLLLNKLHLQLKSDHEENSKNKKECTEEEFKKKIKAYFNRIKKIRTFQDRS